MYCVKIIFISVHHYFSKFVGKFAVMKDNFIIRLGIGRSYTQEN